ncbi:MAG TPA: DUF983 domain-containing protein [Alteraurantiacibacter sp.]|jgi:uncharacterized protein (DUF983 family)
MNRPADIAPEARLPASYGEAAMRAALKARCPRCGEAPLFRKWLKPVDACASCGQDWTLHSADDFPPYISIFVTGHLLAPLIILLVDLGLSVMATLAILVPLAVAMMLTILQPAKGAIIAMQYWLGLSGFVRERLPGAGGGETR